MSALSYTYLFCMHNIRSSQTCVNELCANDEKAWRARVLFEGSDVVFITVGITAIEGGYLKAVDCQVRGNRRIGVVSKVLA